MFLKKEIEKDRLNFIQIQRLIYTWKSILMIYQNQILLQRNHFRIKMIEIFEAHTERLIQIHSISLQTQSKIIFKLHLIFKKILVYSCRMNK